jgi:hypothetical protein
VPAVVAIDERVVRVAAAIHVVNLDAPVAADVREGVALDDQTVGGNRALDRVGGDVREAVVGDANVGVAALRRAGAHVDAGAFEGYAGDGNVVRVGFDRDAELELVEAEDGRAGLARIRAAGAEYNFSVGRVKSFSEIDRVAGPGCVDRVLDSEPLVRRCNLNGRSAHRRGQEQSDK